MHFFWLIRSFNQFQENVSYVLTGSISKTSDIIENGENGAFGGRMIQINIDPFTKEETRSYFNDKLTDITFTEDGFDRFYKCTRGIPAYINSFYNLLSSNEVYDEEKIINTFKINTDQILVMWIKIWGTLNKYEKQIILEIVENGNISWKKLVEKTGYSTATVNKYINSLQNKGIVGYQKKKYYLEDKMLKTWIIYEKEVRGMYPL